MCGRYYYSPSDLRRELPGLAFQSEDDTPRDMSPGCVATVIVGEENRLVLEEMLWGFDNSKGGLIINARSETVDEKPIFKPLSGGQRCAIPASRYYEWRRSDRQKYDVDLKDGKLFFMAGLYRIGRQGREFVILTQAPVPAIAPVHNRMPLILDSSAALRRWLGGERPVFDANSSLNVRTEGPEQLRMTF